MVRRALAPHWAALQVHPVIIAMQLTPEEITRLVFSFLGGGLVVGLLNLWQMSRQERKRRRIEAVRSELQGLYGPLQFFTSSNSQLFSLVDKLNEAYTAEYVGKNWSDSAHERVSAEAMQTIDLSNEYIRQVVANNERILEILIQNYALIDPDDTEVFAQFIVDYTRNKTEYSEGGLKTPLNIYEHLGSVSFMRPKFIAAVDKRFRAKKAELKRLLN
jgi:hypothetical protein